MADRDYTPYQQKIIKRYYENRDDLQLQRLSEIVTDIYLAEGKKRERLWTQAGEAMACLGLPESRIRHILGRRDPALLPGLLKELEAKTK